MDVPEHWWDAVVGVILGLIGWLVNNKVNAIDKAQVDLQSDVSMLKTKQATITQQLADHEKAVSHRFDRLDTVADEVRDDIKKILGKIGGN